MFTYKTCGVCSREIHFDIVDGKLHNVSFDGGCPGNLTAIGKLVTPKQLLICSRAMTAAVVAPAALTNWPKLSPSIYNII